MRRPALWAALAGLSLLLLLFDLPLVVKTVVIWLALVVTPGSLLVEILVGHSTARPTRLEGILYAVGAGYALLVVVMLALSYVPGGLHAWQIVSAYAGILIVLVVVLARMKRTQAGVTTTGDAEVFPDAYALTGPPTWLTIGLAAILLLAAGLRLTSLGYSEFHGDEARAVLRAAAVIQGYEDVLSLHRKAPGEILVPATVFALTGSMNEASARLPFSLANLATLAGVFLLGWRMFGLTGGFTAALLLTVNGYLVAFARFTQYQSVVVLLSLLAVLAAYRLYRHPHAVTRYLLLIALFLSAGLLFHYDTLLAALPIAVLLVAAGWEKRVAWGVLGRGIVVADVVGTAILALFYIPYVASPHFSANLYYLWHTRIHTQSTLPYNNLESFFLRAALYNSSYYILLLIVLTLAALGFAYWRGLRSPWRYLAVCLLTVAWGATLWRNDWPAFGGTDFTFSPFLLALFWVLLLPRVPIGERAIWLWFGAPFLASMFLIAEPDTHVHIFFVPWVLTISAGLKPAWDGLRRRAGPNRSAALAAGAALLIVVVFGLYDYLLYDYHSREILLQEREAWPAAYWLPPAAQKMDARYGFPLENGWKAVGALYAQGILTGDYDSNSWFDWTPAWYTRGQARCNDTADWYFAVNELEPWSERADAVADRVEALGFQRWAVVQHGRAPGLVIYGREGAIPAPDAALDLAASSPLFDAAMTSDLPLDYPVVRPRPTRPLSANLDNRIELEGYDLEYATPLRAGDPFELTLYWRALAPIEDSLKVFNQARDANNVMLAQQDSIPVCNRHPTSEWSPGEQIVDRHTLHVADDARPGVYPLYTGMYLEETLERLPVLDSAGNPQGTEILLDELTIAP